MDYFASCPFCHVTLLPSELERHANSHFEDDDKNEQVARDLELAQQLASTSAVLPLQESNMDMDMDAKICCLIALQSRSSFYHVKAAGGLMALLCRRLELDADDSHSHTDTVLLSGYVDHFQSMPFEDVGWGCGWRNIQMLASHLLSCRQDARQLLFGGSAFVPDIPSLQRWLEIAWEKGFDALGSHHFNRSIYGSKHWIGTTECAALFRSFGVRARIVDFGPKQSKSSFLSVPGTSLGSQESHQVLLDWVWNYFSEGSTSAHHCHVIVTEKAPLYFQHDGHSRTVVGIQVRHQKNGMPECNLLILDPAHRTAALERSLEENVGWKKLIKRGVHTLTKPQYQLCYIDPGIASGEEMEQLKTIDSVFIEF